VGFVTVVPRGFVGGPERAGVSSSAEAKARVAHPALSSECPSADFLSTEDRPPGTAPSWQSSSSTGPAARYGINVRDRLGASEGRRRKGESRPRSLSEEPAPSAGFAGAMRFWGRFGGGRRGPLRRSSA